MELATFLLIGYVAIAADCLYLIDLYLEEDNV